MSSNFISQDQFTLKYQPGKISVQDYNFQCYEPTKNQKEQNSIIQNQPILSKENTKNMENNSKSVEKSQQSRSSDFDTNFDKKYSNRSSNNSHKKYSACAKKNLFKYLKSERKNEILELYKCYKSSRIYFFCLLIHTTIELDGKAFKKFTKSFVKDVKERILKYEGQIIKTQNQRLRKFRSQQIEDIKISLISFKLFLTSSIEEGIQCLYKKSNNQVLKLPEYQRSVLIIKEIQQQSKIKQYGFDIKKVIDNQLNRKIKNIEITLPQSPEYIETFKSSRAVSDQPLVQQFSSISEVRVEIVKVQYQKEQTKKEMFMNKKTVQEEQEDQQPYIEQHPSIFNPYFSNSNIPFMFGQGANHQFYPFGFPGMNTMNGLHSLSQMPYSENRRGPSLESQNSMYKYSLPFYPSFSERSQK